MGYWGGQFWRGPTFGVGGASRLRVRHGESSSIVEATWCLLELQQGQTCALTYSFQRSIFDETILQTPFLQTRHKLLVSTHNW